MALDAHCREKGCEDHDQRHRKELRGASERISGPPAGATVGEPVQKTMNESEITPCEQHFRGFNLS